MRLRVSTLKFQFKKNLSHIHAVQALLQGKQNDLPYRPGAAVAVLLIEFILVFFILACFIRFILTLFSNPGYIPRGERPKIENPEIRDSRDGPDRREPHSDTRQEKHKRDESPYPKFLDRDAVREGILECPPGLEQFYSKEVFMCGMDGVPRFCNVCWNWKPGRTHHCSELGRCVRRFDHYCPWYVGFLMLTPSH
jgi:palmitoyltransferase